MKPRILDRASFQARVARYSVSVLLGLAAIVYAEFAAAADPNQGIGGDHQVTERTAADGVAVLRGTRPPSQPVPARRSNGSGSTVIVTPWFAAPNGGFDTSLDRSGLSPPGGILNLGPYSHWGD